MLGGNHLRSHGFRDFTESFSTFVDQLKNETSSGNLTRSEAAKRLADFYEAEYVKFSQVATEYAVKAGTAGDPARQEVWRRTADMLRGWADQRQGLSDEAWLKHVEAVQKGNIGKFFGPVGDALDVAQMLTAISMGDWNKLGEISSGMLFGTVAGVFAAALLAPLELPVLAVAVIVAGASWAFSEFGEWLWGKLFGIDPAVNGEYRGAQIWTPPRRDPFALDLDGDGLETVGVGEVVFDHDNDGIKTGTGWIKPDDGLLVLDRNGNGTIDDGTELFGDSTPLSGGGTAADGFEALGDLDSNADGRITADDVQFGDLRVWRDLNQDGISQSNELFSLNDLGISAINLDKTDTNLNLGNGNVLASEGTFEWADGTTGQTGIAATGDLDFAENPFYSEFTTSVTLTAAAEALPEMRGSGQVRDLREAASLSEALESTLSAYANATTKAEQMALLDQLILDWASTSEMPSLVDRALDANFIVNYQFGTTAGGVDPTNGTGVLEASGSGGGSAGGIAWGAYNQNQSPEYQMWLNRMIILERFNGTTFIDFVPPTNPDESTAIEVTSSDGNGGSGVVGNFYRINVTLAQPQLDLLEQSYQALRDSIYQGLLLQTRLKPFTEAIGLTLIDGEIALDFSGMETIMTDRVSSDAANGVLDILEFSQVTGGVLIDSGWDGWMFLGDMLRGMTVTPEVQAVLDEYHVKYLDGVATEFTGNAESEFVIGNATDNVLDGGQGNDTVAGGEGNDVLTGGDGNGTVYGGEGNDTLSGNNGNDTLDGGTGADTLWGGNDQDTLVGGDGDDVLHGGYGSDLLQGSAGDDVLGGHSDDYYGQTYVNGQYVGDTFEGGAGNDLNHGTYYGDTYLFNLGDGADEIRETYHWGGSDVVRFGAGIAPADISITRSGNDLVLSHANGTDRITVTNWYQGSQYQLESVEFADGTVWDHATLHTPGLTLTGTEGADTLTGGNVGGEVLQGLGGDDTLTGNQGDDTLEGGDGADVLNGNNGNDLLDGGAGADTLWGGQDQDTLIGGDGADVLHGGYGSDLLQGGAGDDVLGGHSDDYYGQTYVNGQYVGDTFEGGAGNDLHHGTYYGDTYLFNLGDGADEIRETYHWGGSDVVRFGAGIANDQLWFSQDGNDLVISVVGVEDEVRISNWYGSSNAQVEEIYTSAGDLLVHNQVQQLVDAMAGFTPPAQGETTMPESYQEDLSPVIASAWQ